MDVGLLGGIIGGVLGVGGGVVGTYFSIRNTKGPLERAFMIKASVVTWLVVTFFLLLMFLLPIQYRFWLWIPYGVLLPWGIIKGNKRIAEIRQEDAI